MTKTTTTVRVYPEDAKRLDGIRRWLQANNGGEDFTISDAVKAAIDAWEK